MTAGRISPRWFRQPAHGQRLLRWALLVFFVWLTGRFWHPYYGFTRFIQLDSSDAAVMLPELREARVYVYSYTGGYDGAAYAQMAVHPAVRDPDLARAVTDLPYRARRILLSWAAYVIGLGDAVRVVHVYAVLNLAVWFGLAALLGKIFPPTGWRNLTAWAGLLFSAGVLHSVRLALTDLSALVLLAGAVWLTERRKETLAAGLLGAAGLVRETALLGGVAMLSSADRRNSSSSIGRLALAALPLGLWLIYLRKFTGPVVNGLVNIGWPFLGWLGKLSTSFRQLGTEPDTWLAWTTVLAFVALTVQLLYVVWRPEPRDPWWRVGAIYAALMLFLSTVVWEGHPGAATRVLLPLGLAFNVLAVRRQAALLWLIAGNLSVCSGLLALWRVPQDPLELAAGRASFGSYVAHTDNGWYQAEHYRNETWAWCAARGGMDIEFWPRDSRIVTVRLAVRGFTPRPLDIRQAGNVLWRGAVEVGAHWIELPAVAVDRGRVRLELNSPVLPVKEGTAPDARALGFALSGVVVK